MPPVLRLYFQVSNSDCSRVGGIEGREGGREDCEGMVIAQSQEKGKGWGGGREREREREGKKKEVRRRRYSLVPRPDTKLSNILTT